MTSMTNREKMLLGKKGGGNPNKCLTEVKVGTDFFVEPYPGQNISDPNNH